MNNLVGNIRQEVLAYRLKNVSLENDLRNLDKVCTAGATEAVVFYSARILEAIINHAYIQFFGPDAKTLRNRKPNLAEMEQQLYSYNQLHQNRYYWVKGLRLLGNEARHELRRINKAEADFALIFLEFVLAWYFCDFQHGLRISSIHKGQNRLTLSSGNLLPELAWNLDSSRLNPNKLKVVFGPRESEYIRAFSNNFTFPLLLIEIFISSSDYVSAERLIETLGSAVGRQKGALRNRFYQLKGLLLSRTGRLEDAEQILETEYTRQKNDRSVVEDEVVGILAGVYKRIWNGDSQESYLEKSFETYYNGWVNSRRSNTYLGINAATTALCLSKQTEAREIAHQVKSLLEKRRRLLLQNTTGVQNVLNYWDLVTLAEARLLSNDPNGAYELYSSAFAQYEKQMSDIASTREQLSALICRVKLDNVSQGHLTSLLS